jgi:hypothetical protein
VVPWPPTMDGDDTAAAVHVATYTGDASSAPHTEPRAWWPCVDAGDAPGDPSTHTLPAASSSGRCVQTD